MVNIIRTKTDLQNMSGDCELANDIDVGGSWAPIVFSGTFDGKGYVISGLNASLFSTLSGSISNLTLSGSVTGGDSSGLLVSSVNGGTLNVTNVKVEGSVSAKKYAGGLVGYAENANITFTECESTVNVSTWYHSTDDNQPYDGSGAGGLVGYWTNAGPLGEFNICKFSGSVSCAQNHCGGIIGHAYNVIKITKCSFDGTLTATKAMATYSYPAGWKFQYYFGGIAGLFEGDSGALELSLCYADGDIVAANGKEAALQVVGGIVGSSSFLNISNCGSIVHVMAKETVGGLVGWAGGGDSYPTHIVNSYAAGLIEHHFGYTGGIIGQVMNNTSTATSTYWDTEVSQVPTSPLGTGLTTAEMLCKVK